MRRFLLLSLLAAGVVLSVGAPLEAHDRAAAKILAPLDDALDSAPVLPPAPVGPGLAWKAAPAPPSHALIILLAAMALLGARRPRRAMAFALVLVLAAFAFESGVHSVHHLGEEAGAVRCAVLSASLHQSCLGVESPAIAQGLTSAGLSVFIADPGIGATRFPCPHEGRAPPSASA